MKKSFGIMLLAIALTAPAAAQMAPASGSGMDAMKYYVGSWSCMAGNVGEKPQSATVTYAMESGLLRQLVNVPPTGKMTMAYIGVSAMSWDAKKHEYVQAWNDNVSGANVSVAKPWTGNTEQWTETYDASGKLGHSKVVRTSSDRFDFWSYPTLASMKANFKGYCTRSAASS